MTGAIGAGVVGATGAIGAGVVVATGATGAGVALATGAAGTGVAPVTEEARAGMLVSPTKSNPRTNKSEGITWYYKLYVLRSSSCFLTYLQQEPERGLANRQ